MLLILLNNFVIAGITLADFKTTVYYDEQVATFKLNPDMRIQINAPSAASFNADKPVGIALFALPNGNTIEQTVGKELQAGDDWHYDIQHIGAQTRFLRNKISDYNLVTVYLEAKQLSWPTWKSQYPNYDAIIKKTVEYLKSYFQEYNPFIILTGHSGGGRFIFSYLDAYDQIPDYVDRICFLDSNYGYENTYGDQMIEWINGAEDRFISVLAYNDSIALYNGEPIVSATGGTWYRSRMMQKYFANYYSFTTEEDDEFIRHTALNGRIKILLKKNPAQAILHTVQVERNGFIHTMLTGTALENDGYEYYGDRAYSEFIQADEIPKNNFQIPLRDPSAMTGSEFMNHVKNMSFTDREDAILNELVTGNIPYFLREMKALEADFSDANGTSHHLEYKVFPDYLSIGSDNDYCRVPMGPITAQKAGDFFGTTMPTRKLVDHIYQNAEVKLAPVTYAPVGDQNEQVYKFVEHNTAIEAQLSAAGGSAGDLIGGTKKDVVLSNKIIDPTRPNHVVIYGWHQLNGEPIQPLTNIHINSYVDYSHGIRYLNSDIKVDGNVQKIQDVLKDAVLYKIVSDEIGSMTQPTYISDSSLPEKPKSFGIRIESEGTARITISPVSNADRYLLYSSKDGLNFNPAVVYTNPEFVISSLPADSIFYFKLASENTAGRSTETEVLAVIPAESKNGKVLVVYGFDRTSTGNTFDFIRQHAAAIAENEYTFESATNDAVLKGLFDLNDYTVVDYILGDESTVDETFLASEQALVSSFLKNGGRLFVSGAEIAWDLDYKGLSTDKSFFHDYLKAQYAADAPGGVSATHYSAKGTSGGIFETVGNFNFDNGSQGTIDVKYADALTPVNGGKEIITYTGVSSYSVGGISFEGTFKGSTEPGKLVYLGFPFETVYPEEIRTVMMNKVLSFLYSDVSDLDRVTEKLPGSYELSQNYPNPFNPVTKIKYQLPNSDLVNLSIYNLLGQKVVTLVSQHQQPGIYTVEWDATGFASDLYICKMTTGRGFSGTRKLTLLK
jgi:hypothetical protein